MLVAKERPRQALLVSEDGNIGDALCAIPIVHLLAEQVDRLYVAFRNAHVLELMQWPKNACPLWEVPPGNTPMLVVRVNAHHSQLGGKRWHPTQHYCAMAGFPMPTTVPRPRVAVGELAVPAYDFLVAPFTANLGERTWPLHNYRALLQDLRATYPGCSVAMLGGRGDPQPWPRLGEAPLGMSSEEVAYEYGRSLPEVIAMMRKAKKAVITVDSAPNRLAWASGIDYHVLVCANVVPEAWGGYPGVHLVYGNIWTITPATVLETVRRAIREPVVT
jgi:hypothetical protein